MCTLLFAPAWAAGDSFAGARLGQVPTSSWECADAQCQVAARWRGLLVRGSAELDGEGRVHQVSLVATFVGDEDLFLLDGTPAALHVQRAHAPRREASSWLSELEAELARGGWSVVGGGGVSLLALEQDGTHSRWQRGQSCLQLGAWPVELTGSDHHTFHLAQVVLEASRAPCEEEDER